jgi:RHS repeat-associated protein
LISNGGRVRQPDRALPHTNTFKYDPFGRRIYKSSSATTSVFAYDGDDLVEEVNSLDAVVARYTQTDGIDEPLAMLRSGATDYYNADGLGSVTSLTSATGAVAQTYAFDSFGKQTASGGSLTNSFQYTSREFDLETGLYYYRARYYDQASGRFLSEDRTRFKSGLDFYGYAFNSPIVLKDPFGLFPTPWHRGATQGAAEAIFGPKCLDSAKTVADADAAVDDFNYGSGGWWGSITGAIQFAFHSGTGWAQPGPHFPTQQMLDQLHNNALSTCNLKDLGESLHSRQDSIAHGGWSSFDHYFHGTIPDTNPANSGLAHAAIMDTAGELSEFKSKCLKCCE